MKTIRRIAHICIQVKIVGIEVASTVFFLIALYARSGTRL
jgi:hypothetical protein